MKVIVLNPWKVFLAGVLSAMLVGASVLGALALVGVFSSDEAQAYGASGVGAKDWYFAEGYTGAGFEEWILIFNPPTPYGSGNDIFPQIRLYGPSGFLGFFEVGLVAPGERRSININQVLLDMYGYSGDVSIVVTNVDSPFLCERALYFDYKGQWAGGSQILGYQEGASE